VKRSLYIGFVSAFILCGALSMSAVNAQTPSEQDVVNASSVPLRVQTKTLADDDRVQVIEERFAPGAESESVARPYRVVRVLRGGKLERIFPNGLRKPVDWRSGEVLIANASAPYILKNVGTDEVVLYAVRLKN